MRAYDRYVVRQRHRYGAEFSEPSRVEVDRFGPYLGDTDVRITVSRTYDNGEVYQRTGYIGITTGWKPAFLLMSRVGSIGSSDLLDAKDTIVSIRPRRVRRPR